MYPFNQQASLLRDPPEHIPENNETQVFQQNPNVSLATMSQQTTAMKMKGIGKNII